MEKQKIQKKYVKVKKIIENTFQKQVNHNRKKRKVKIKKKEIKMSIKINNANISILPPATMYIEGVINEIQEK